VARKDVLLGITQAETARPDRATTPGYAVRGASRSMMTSIGELAAQAAKAERLLEGEAVVDLDVGLIDVSFVSDRLGDVDEAFADLVKAVQERGQDSPILVRPHPIDEGRYQIVFGHRRAKVARVLGIPVRAVVKSLNDQEHVVAQGQENSARENLTFIERAVFAQRLMDLGNSRETVQAALSIDAPMLTRMLSVTQRVPETIIQAIGAARGVGRDRWLDLTVLMEKPTNAERVSEYIQQSEFQSADGQDRFNSLFKFLKSSVPSRKVRKISSKATAWAPADKLVTVSGKSTSKGYDLALRDKDATLFGGWISENLDELYRAFRESDKGQK
jgi:ParB family chromosome partitioning protein